MNYDQIVRELKKLGLNVDDWRNGGSKGIRIEFERVDTMIYGSMTLSFELNYSKDHRFGSSIREEKEGQRFTPHIEPANQTEFFQYIKELHTTDTPFLQIQNKKWIKEAEKEIEKLDKQFKDVDFRLNERKLWLMYLKGEISKEEKKERMRELIKRVRG